MMHPGHQLWGLFIVPLWDFDRQLDVSKLIPLATYLDCLFPNLSDVTSFFEGRAENRAFSSWKNLDQLLESYQNIRQQAVQFGQSLSTAGATSDIS